MHFHPGNPESIEEDLYCEILSTLYIKSNGQIPCNDDAGEWTELANLEVSPTINHIINHERFSYIDQKLRSDNVPWSGICEECAFFRPDQDHCNLLRERRIKKIQVETSLACTLRCPSCSRLDQIKKRPGSKFLDFDNFKTFLESIVEQKFCVDWIEYCGQGEPLSHPQFPDYVALVKKLLPKTKQRLITNGNYNFKEKIGDLLLDQVIVSCDGATASSYGKYRVRGSFSKVTEFMKACCNSQNVLSTVWKYILFSHNDSDGEIRLAHKTACDIGSCELLFVLTHSVEKSTKYTSENIDRILALAPNSIINLTPIQLANWHIGTPKKKPKNIVNRLLKACGYFCLDEIKLINNDFILFKGWAADVNKRPVKSLRITAEVLDDVMIDNFYYRPDVDFTLKRKSKEKEPRAKYGFAAVLKLTRPLNLKASTLFIITTESNSGLKKRRDVSVEFEHIFQS